jgi:RHS repeat-associated protein
VGTRAIPAYWDDLQLSVETTPAASYDLQVAEDAAFDALVTDVSGITTTSYVDTLSRYETEYWWRVRAHNASGTGPWSAVRPITTRDAPPRRYYIKDHLGSVRVVVDATGEVKETRDYYPFGLRMPGRSTTTGTPAPEDYTGHELDPQTQLHYAGARYYMSALGRWTTTDPKADKNYADSPYTYVVNDPINYVDLAGMDTTATTDSGDEVTIEGEGSGLPSDPTGIVVTAERQEKSSQGGDMQFTIGGQFAHGVDAKTNTFYFNSSTQDGLNEFYNRLLYSASGGCNLIGNAQFSMHAQKVAMTACVHAGMEKARDSWQWRLVEGIVLQTRWVHLGKAAVAIGRYARGSNHLYRTATISKPLEPLAYLDDINAVANTAYPHVFRTSRGFSVLKKSSSTVKLKRAYHHVRPWAK